MPKESLQGTINYLIQGLINALKSESLLSGSKFRDIVKWILFHNGNVENSEVMETYKNYTGLFC